MITLIAAVARNNCIGVNGRMPWHIPEDFTHFKEHTMGNVVLMGRKTWESLPPKFRPLPNRTNVVISRQAGYDTLPDVEVYATIDGALHAHAHDDVYVIGGAGIYEQTIDRADRLIITHVDREVAGDAFFPTIDLTQWSEAARKQHEGFSFVTYERVKEKILNSAF